MNGDGNLAGGEREKQNCLSQTPIFSFPFSSLCTGLAVSGRSLEGEYPVHGGWLKGGK